MTYRPLHTLPCRVMTGSYLPCAYNCIVYMVAEYVVAREQYEIGVQNIAGSVYHLNKAFANEREILRVAYLHYCELAVTVEFQHSFTSFKMRRRSLYGSAFALFIRFRRFQLIRVYLSKFRMFLQQNSCRFPAFP